MPWRNSVRKGRVRVQCRMTWLFVCRWCRCLGCQNRARGTGGGSWLQGHVMMSLVPWRKQRECSASKQWPVARRVMVEHRVQSPESTAASMVGGRELLSGGAQATWGGGVGGVVVGYAPWPSVPLGVGGGWAHGEFPVKKGTWKTALQL